LQAYYPAITVAHILYLHLKTS